MVFISISNENTHLGLIMFHLLSALSVAYLIVYSKSDLVNDINSKNLGWKAKMTLTDTAFREDILPEILTELVNSTRKNIRFTGKNISLPAEFDWRKSFNSCKHEAVNGGPCASSWAIAPALMANYRACKQSKKLSYSAQRILACCKSCGAGCYGGYPWRALNYLRTVGVPSEKCQQFVLSTVLPIRALKPNCRILKRCDAKSVVYKESKIKSTYMVSDIMEEIYTSGPLLSYMSLYEDLFLYEQGIYKHKFGKNVGRLSVLLLGWGTVNGTDYWLAENTWGSEWGEGGYFRIIRHGNHVNIEQYVIAASVF